MILTKDATKNKDLVAKWCFENISLFLRGKCDMCCDSDKCKECFLYPTCACTDEKVKEKCEYRRKIKDK